MSIWRNLLHDTKEMLEAHGKTTNDVDFVTNGDQSTSWGIFENLADQEFRDEVNPNLKVVGEDWWLERNNDFDSNNWTFKERPELTKFVYDKFEITLL